MTLLKSSSSRGGEVKEYLRLMGSYPGDERAVSFSCGYGSAIRDVLQNDNLVFAFTHC